MSENAFLEALRNRDTRRAHAMLEEEPSLAEARTPEGASALMVALYMRLTPLADAIVEAGVKPDVFEAVVMDDVPLVRRLLDEAPGTLASRAPDGFTPLHLAAHFGSLDAMVVLLDRGATVEAEASNDMANRPLHAAAAGCQARATRVLVDEGASVDARDAGGNTALHIAAANGHRPTVERLLAAGADPGLRNDEGHTPAQTAAARGFDALAEELSPPPAGDTPDS